MKTINLFGKKGSRRTLETRQNLKAGQVITARELRDENSYLKREG